MAVDAIKEAVERNAAKKRANEKEKNKTKPNIEQYKLKEKNVSDKKEYTGIKMSQKAKGKNKQTDIEK